MKTHLESLSSKGKENRKEEKTPTQQTEVTNAFTGVSISNDKTRAKFLNQEQVDLDWT